MTHLPVPLLAVDPSSTKIGWALIGSGPSYITSGVYNLATTAPADERIVMAGHASQQIIDNCRQSGCLPALIVIEVPDFVAKYATQNIVPYWRAAGAVEYAIAISRIPLARVPASGWKSPERKDRYKQRFLEIVGRYAYHDDESDALCMAWDYLLSIAGAPSNNTSQPQNANRWPG